MPERIEDVLAAPDTPREYPSSRPEPSTTAPVCVSFSADGAGGRGDAGG